MTRTEKKKWFWIILLILLTGGLVFLFFTPWGKRALEWIKGCFKKKAAMNSAADTD